MRGIETNDYKKLSRVTTYNLGTIGLPLFLSINRQGNIKWYVDAAFELNKDMRSHTGGFMTMGIGGGGYVQSRKQNLNTNSSTESELVGVDDVLDQVIWT